MTRRQGWVRPVGRGRRLADGSIVQDYRLRLWHPSFAAALWRITDVRQRALKPLVVLLAWLYLIVRVRA